MSERPTYTAVCRRSGRWWAFEVKELNGVFGQAKRLDQVADAARDVIVLMLDLDDDEADAFDIVVEPHLSAELDNAIRDAVALREQAEREQAAVAQATRETANRLTEEAGLPMRDVGWLLGLSHQRVAQLVKR